MLSRKTQIANLCSALVLILGAGCNPATDGQTAYDEEDIKTTVAELENQFILGVDALQCDLPEVGEGDPIFVANASVVRSARELREVCPRMLESRSGGEWNVETLSVHILSEDAAYVVREGSYQMHFTDRESKLMDPAVLTSIWHRSDGEWKMVHLHESYVDAAEVDSR